MGIKEFLLKRPRAYCLARCFVNNDIYNLYNLVSGYYEVDNNMISLDAELSSTDTCKGLVYDISFGKDKICEKGFCALLRHTLMLIAVSDILNIPARVLWGKHNLYYDADIKNTDNAFEYYFVNMNNEMYSRSVKINGNINHYRKLITNKIDYNVRDEEINFLADVFKKHIQLNDNTKKYLEGEIKSIISCKNTLGIHARGTDFNVGFKNHPIMITTEEYLYTAKKLFLSGDYDSLFLATDDKNILKMFENEFGDKLVYYRDTYRSDDIEGPHSKVSNRPLHHYKLGLEVLRDAYTLAHCDSLICGLSQVSIMARYVNKALERNFRHVIVMNKGIHSESSDLAIRLDTDYLKRQKDFQHDLHQNP